MPRLHALQAAVLGRREALALHRRDVDDARPLRAEPAAPRPPPPLTATRLSASSSPRRRLPSLSPTAYAIDVDAWPARMMSCSDTWIAQNGASPSYWRIVGSWSRRPVRTLW